MAVNQSITSIFDEFIQFDEDSNSTPAEWALVFAIDGTITLKEYFDSILIKCIKPLIAKIYDKKPKGFVLNMGSIVFRDVHKSKIPIERKEFINDQNQFLDSLKRIKFEHGEYMRTSLLEGLVAALEMLIDRKIAFNNELERKGIQSTSGSFMSFVVLITGTEGYVDSPLLLNLNESFDNLVFSDLPSVFKKLDIRLSFISPFPIYQIDKIFEESIKYPKHVVDMTEEYGFITKIAGLLPDVPASKRTADDMLVPEAKRLKSSDSTVTIKQQIDPEDSKNPQMTPTVSNMPIQNHSRSNSLSSTSLAFTKLIYNGQITLVTTPTYLTCFVDVFIHEKYSLADVVSNSWPMNMVLDQFFLNKSELLRITKQGSCGLVSFKPVSNELNIETFNNIFQYLSYNKKGAVVKLDYKPDCGIVIFPNNNELIGVVFIKRKLPSLEEISVVERPLRSIDIKSLTPEQRKMLLEQLKREKLNNQ